MAETPSIARAALRQIIRDLRAQAGLEQSDVAARLNVHPDTVRRWETGEIALKTANAMALAAVFGASSAELSRMTTLAEQSRQRGAVEKSGGGAYPEFRIYADFEPTATAIWSYEPEYLPGLVQTSDYLRAVHAAHLPEQIPNAAAVHELRRSRHATMFARTDPPDMRFLIGVAAMVYLDRLDPEVRDGQIAQLHDIGGLPTVEIRVIDVMHPGMSGGYTLLTPAAEIRAAARFVYVEGEGVVRYDETPDVVSRHDRMFHSAWSRARQLKEYLA